eukprot:TRINITY_DN6077_c0_g1_i1.p1 TRINITY_DN6077_c0_g1~~TRINITY_DN6077_c0_g1_i1.p1  ORF type:complete len:476 (+),score=136.92 TRINITY_DN6077_c0_g1_i1:53-1480(+)
MLRNFIHRGLTHTTRPMFVSQCRWVSKKASTDILNSYLEYWNHIRFRQGWAKPQFTSDEVKGLLEDAAEHAAAIYEELDKESSEPKLRKRGGESIAFLSGVGYDPVEHPERFVRELVHSTLSDVTGYVEGLTTEKVDSLMTARHKHRLIITQLENLRRDLEWSTYKAKDKAANLITEAIEVLQNEKETCDEEEDEEEAKPKIHINVTSHAQSVKNLVEKTDIKWEKVKEDPSTYNEELKGLQEKCAESTAVLMKDLLALQQEVQSAVKEGSKADEEIKSEILKIHGLLGTVDEVSKRIQVLKTATENEMSRQKEEEKVQQAAEETKKTLAKLNTWFRTLVDTMSSPSTWSSITIKPDFNERNGPHYSLISTYVPNLLPNTCEVNVNHDVLKISGTCAPTKQDIEKSLSPIVQAAAKDPQSAASLMQRNHEEFAQYLSQGRWGTFTKYYTLPCQLPSHAVRAQVSIRAGGISFWGR